MSSSVHVVDVEVRSWPERTDVLVIDYRRARPLAHYPLALAQTPANSLDALYRERAAFVMRALQEEQKLLRQAMELGDQEEVRLRSVEEPRERIDALLGEYDLSLDDVEVARLGEALAKLQSMDLLRLWELLGDWHDIVELHRPGGTSLSKPESWVHSAHPERASHYLELATGLEAYDEADEADQRAAREMFEQLVSPPLDRLHFGHLLRWVFFTRSEFAGQELATPPAFAELGL